MTARTRAVVQRPQPIQISRHQGEYPPKPHMTSQLPTSTVMTSQIHPSMTSQLRHPNPYDYPSATPPLNHDIMPNMRFLILKTD